MAILFFDVILENFQ